MALLRCLVILVSSQVLVLVNAVSNLYDQAYEAPNIFVSFSAGQEFYLKNVVKLSYYFLPL
jgi:hypothetical protein